MTSVTTNGRCNPPATHQLDTCSRGNNGLTVGKSISFSPRYADPYYRDSLSSAYLQFHLQSLSTRSPHRTVSETIHTVQALATRLYGQGIPCSQAWDAVPLVLLKRVETMRDMRYKRLRWSSASYSYFPSLECHLMYIDRSIGKPRIAPIYTSS